MQEDAGMAGPPAQVKTHYWRGVKFSGVQVRPAPIFRHQ